MSCEKERSCGTDYFANYGFIVLVLFILLAIILGAVYIY